MRPTRQVIAPGSSALSPSAHIPKLQFGPLGSVRRATHATRVNARDAAFQEVSQWIQYHGGHVHPKLDVALTDLGCRGVVTSSNLSTEDQERPVMMVPVDLCISSHVNNTPLNAHLVSHGLPVTWWADTAAGLTQRMSGSFLDVVFARRQGRGGDRQQALPGMTLVTDQLLVALILAFEKRLGAQSRYNPFVSGLTEPTCGFSLSDAEIRIALSGAPPECDVVGIIEAMRHARWDYAQAIAMMAPLLEAADLSESEVGWALEHVLSRSLSNSQARVTLVPAIDCLNHSSDSCPPATVRGTTTCYFNMDRDCAIRGLGAGSELFLHYAARASQEDSPLKFFLRFAFVPDECWAGRSEVPSMAAFQRSVQERFASVL